MSEAGPLTPELIEGYAKGLIQEGAKLTELTTSLPPEKVLEQLLGFTGERVPAPIRGVLWCGMGDIARSVSSGIIDVPRATSSVRWFLIGLWTGLLLFRERREG